MHGNTVPVLFYTTGTSVYSVIFHGSPLVIKLIRANYLSQFAVI